jgi:hypothetical protein
MVLSNIKPCRVAAMSFGPSAYLTPWKVTEPVVIFFEQYKDDHHMQLVFVCIACRYRVLFGLRVWELEHNHKDVVPLSTANICSYCHFGVCYSDAICRHNCGHCARSNQRHTSKRRANPRHPLRRTSCGHPSMGSSCREVACWQD